MSVSRILLSAIALAVIVGGCTRPLPEPESAAALLYATRCGSCHVAHHPGTMTKKMWEVWVVRMGTEIQTKGQPMLTQRETSEILAYVQRHASNSARAGATGGVAPAEVPAPGS